MGKKTDKKKIPEEKVKMRPEVLMSIWAIIFLSTSAILWLASFDKAGPAGRLLFKFGNAVLGIGYYLIPVTLMGAGILFLLGKKRELMKHTTIGSTVFILGSLGLIDILYPGKSGWFGSAIGWVEVPFGYWAGIIISVSFIIIGFIFALDIPVKINPNLKLIKKPSEKIIVNGEGEESENETASVKNEITPGGAENEKDKKENKDSDISEDKFSSVSAKKGEKKLSFKNYVPPPINLLNPTIEKPTVGDLRANANIIKRTLDSFGIPVEMGEITIGPKVTRYTLKPAEGIKLSRITALNQDLALALAAHPLRIEAPIPGKSLVGIEVPNKIAAMVRLGSLLNFPEFNSAGHLGFALGKGLSGEPVFPDIAKMPHLLVAGATGSGKSVTIHSIIISLLYKNSPETLRFIFIDPKRVELSVYSGLPHLVAPVITEGKKAVSALRWAIAEMDRRYEELLREGFRDIKGYNEKHKEDPMSYLVIVIDELADLMTTYGREVEGSIVRLAQMARATGIHLIVSTQRPSVEVITGLIKANITTRIALQVASQIDSRTILDTSGAEKLLGGGDMLLVSSSLSKPRRIQGSFISDKEIKDVSQFIIENNEGEINDLSVTEPNELEGILSSSTGDEDEDELFPDALEVIKEAGKASASLLQRRLKIGYARAARLLDIMESKGIVGPADGAKPREIYLASALNPEENDE
ncbi:MAG: DNA translocase FtsK [Candidatus Colwellbacteria bacterium]|jgi:S-DNA-T family DNA segregation ATPase FtsK/SpoIIIE|nr:DNA translocase FtsK [Candidatus Colwellbacteria bacterium]MCK9497255.1 DNA translocase FtsK [Candidatus Colwellbacteria bacterium]MDD4819024.1 DNA translocase FtsK [Candidatus Colwellbacteria bacterium]